MNAVDTNIVLYLFDPASPQKQGRARQLFDDLLLELQETVLLWQVKARRQTALVHHQ